MVVINDFVAHAPVPATTIEAYRGRVPDELIEVWETYGFGTFAEGFMRVIDPTLYEAQVGHCIGKTQGDGIAIPVIVTGLGDLITWEPSLNSLVGIRYRLGTIAGLGKAKTFFNLIHLDGAEELSETHDWDHFPAAVAMHGELPYEQSFVFVPLLSMGGTAKVENLHKRDMIAAIQVAVELQGVIEH